MVNNSDLLNAQTINPWDLPQQRTELKQYTKLYQLDNDELATLTEFLNGEQVEIYYDLNDDTDYAVQHIKNGKLAIAKISECVTINGVRWHLQPGKNIIPRAVYEFLMQCPEQKRKLSCPVAGKAEFYGKYESNK